MQALTCPRLAPAAGEEAGEAEAREQQLSEQYAVREFVLKQFLQRPRSRAARGL